MGNSNNLCGIIPEYSLNLGVQQDRNLNELKPSRTIEKIISKPFFVKISISDDNHEDFPQEEQAEQQKQASQQQAYETVSSIKEAHLPNSQDCKEQMIPTDTLTLQAIMQMQQKKISNTKIAVNWNSFIKIKKKNYLEDYIFIKQIGKGAFGSVLKIKMKYGGLYRAAKVIKSSVVSTQKGVTGKIFAEISIPMKLDHPNLIKMFEVFEWKQQYFLIMQLCEGGDLFHNIKQSRFFSEEKTKHIIKQILSAINYMHKQNVCHRDIKPQNILVDPEGKTLKIIDFGTATYFQKEKKLKDLVGTPYYIAPEVIEGKYD